MFDACGKCGRCCGSGFALFACIIRFEIDSFGLWFVGLGRTDVFCWVLAA